MRAVIVQRVNEDFFHFEHLLPNVVSDHVVLACEHCPVARVACVFRIQPEARITGPEINMNTVERDLRLQIICMHILRIMIMKYL